MTPPKSYFPRVCTFINFFILKQLIRGVINGFLAHFFEPLHFFRAKKKMESTSSIKLAAFVIGVLAVVYIMQNPVPVTTTIGDELPTQAVALDGDVPATRPAGARRRDLRPVVPTTWVTQPSPLKGYSASALG